MQCTSPYDGYRAVEGGLSASKGKAYGDLPLTVRCGRCMGCRIHRSYVWAIRCTHEASLYDNNIFATFTYNDEHLPFGETLVRDHMPAFFKRLRKTNLNLRMFYCGEYGGLTNRPHYHALIFNYKPSDSEHFTTRDGTPVYTSQKLTETWGMGNTEFGNVTFESASYTAGYITKKINGDRAEDHYQWIDPDTGQIIDRLPEFQGQSLRPGIGHNWIKQYCSDVYPRDLLVINGRKVRPPRFYDQYCEKHHPDLWAETVKRRKEQYKTKIIERENGQKAVKNHRDPNEYYGTGRQMIAKNKIILSKQRDREPDK